MWRKLFILGIMGSLCLSTGIFQLVHAETQSSGITVGATVPTPAGSGGGVSGSSGGGASDSPTVPPKKVDAKPVISNVQTAPGFTNATVNWSASDDVGIKMSAFVYGTSLAYGAAGSIMGSYQVVLSGLATDTLYYFRITVTDTANQTIESTGSFKTKSESDTTAPIISNVQVVVGVNNATITWDTNEVADSQVQYGKTAAYGSRSLDMSDVLKHRLVLVDVMPSTLYHFRVISTDANGNAANSLDATFKTLKKMIPPPDVSGLTVSTVDGKIVLRWENPTDLAAPDFQGVRIIRKAGSQPRSLNDGVEVYKGSGQLFSDSGVTTNINYFYTIFSFDTSNNYSAGVFGSAELPPQLGEEMCANGLDDNLNGKIDCADAACALAASCTAPPTPPEAPPSNLSGTPAPSPTVPEFLQLSPAVVRFFAANRSFPLAIDNGVVANLAGFTFTVALPQSVLGQTPVGVIFIVDDKERHQLVYNETDQHYYTDLVFPGVGTHQSYLKIEYGSDQTDIIPFILHSYALGQVFDDAGHLIEGATATLLYESGGLVSLQSFGQSNPQTTGAAGRFGWLVPNGKYYAKISAAGWYDYGVPLQNIGNNVFAPTVTLITIPPTLADVIDFNKPLAENIKNVSKNLAAKSKAAAKVLHNISNDPQVEKVASDVVAPTAVGIAVVGAAPLISWLDLLPLLRLVFLQPLLLLGRKKRQGWGQVYNSLNKLPIDLAIIRLIDFQTGKVVQSRVTDKNGRYYFTVNPGNYRLEVIKEKMVFPSVLLKDYPTDGQKADVYHGEQVAIQEKDPVITANIPLDPSGENKTPRRLIWEKIAKQAQVVLSWFGLIVTAVSLYIAPKWYVGALLVGHVVMFFVFRRLASLPKSKSWGIVYDNTSKTPVARAVARLFSSQFNKLVSTQITDSKGRYYFLAGDNRYYVTYDHKDYQSNKTNEIDLSGKEIATIGSNIGLTKKGVISAPPSPPPAPLSTDPAPSGANNPISTTPM